MRFTNRRIGVRWTVGDVSDEGFRALQLSIWGAWRVFQDEADYVICVNSLPLLRAREKTGTVPRRVSWQHITDADVPVLLHNHLDGHMAEGVAWKFAPLRIFPKRHEISLDNDCILWSLPSAMHTWLESKDRCLMALDVSTCLGQFARLCGPEPRNSGIRGLPPGFDLEGALCEILADAPVKLESELDEQGLQAAALSRGRELLAVALREVTICSPFPPHLPFLGKCGAHFVGLNARNLPWALKGRSASEMTREHWNRLRPGLSRYVPIPSEPGALSPSRLPGIGTRPQAAFITASDSTSDRLPPPPGGNSRSEPANNDRPSFLRTRRGDPFSKGPQPQEG